MSIRTTSKAVTFTRPFHLDGIEGEYPAGSYAVETEEALIDAPSVVAYRRIATWIRLPLPSRAAGSSQTVMIDPAALDAALGRDGAPQEAYGPETLAEYTARVGSDLPG